MCGITGLIHPAGSTAEDLRGAVAGMTRTLVHRGPDDEGVWLDDACGVALGHRRLAILDLSQHAHQPMFSPCGRMCLVFNGEIYNHAALRSELETHGHCFRGHGDTEVLLAALCEWGHGEAARRLVGMFAFAVWDRREQVLTLVRDPVGIKPLYYGWQNGCFVFGSELKAIRAHPQFRGEIDRTALALLLRHNYVPSPHSIYRDIYKLPPGAMLSVSPRGLPSHVSPGVWWDVTQAAEQGTRDQLSGTPEQAVDELDRRLRESVRMEMESDVPLGVFLSGGIDSSTVAALMQVQSRRPVKTFTIGFEEASHNEALYARSVAQHLGTEHTELYVTGAQARDVIPQLPELYDEPFADSSQVPTAVLASLARRHVTVCLSGDGGDELFCGYDRYFYLRSLWRRFGWCPAALRQMGSCLANGLSARLSPGRLGARLRTLGEMLSAASGREFYARFNTHWRNPAEVVLGIDPAQSPLTCPGLQADLHYLLDQMMCLDTATYLPDDLLVKVDRASMAVGLEVRVPLLDHRIVAFAWTVPLGLKVRGGQPKWLLRQVLKRYVPRQLVDRPKMGFGVPLDAWLRGPLRGWAEDLLDQNRLRREGFFRPEPIRRKWAEHLSGRVNWCYLLWDVLMFESWLQAGHGAK